MRAKDISIDTDKLSIPEQAIEKGKVKVIVLDGVQGKAKVTEAVEHGSTIIETAKGKTAKIRYEEGELF
ncbi:XtrA/YqaO family protein [Halobacillus salinarum]|uniref:XtrA/YqaO family protein n=1 Tax=Halobacillus salinarum TaxID=2932257 RepID=A0ABY4EFW7_9BACI|nr:XtrA/YqaO family protein [Halobacillus salinarum]UOQ43371.1 XtrA/YqaO family protein [Halobacillus salinarum]